MHEMNDDMFLRAVADHELSAEAGSDAADRLASLDPSGEKIASARSFKAAIGRSMDEAAAPEGLRDRIAMMMRDADVATDADTDAVLSENSETVETPLGDTRSRSFWRGALPQLAALAAMIAIAAAVVVQSARLTETTPEALSVDNVSYVASAHTSCERCKVTRSKRLCNKDIDHESAALIHSTLDAGHEVCQILGRMVEGGWTLEGWGACRFPDDVACVHAMFARGEGDDSEMLSVFFEDSRDLSSGQEFKQRVCYLIENCDKKHDELAAWREGNLVIIAYSESREATAAAIELLEAPDRRIHR